MIKSGYLASFWQKKIGENILCLLCPHKCIIASGKSGFCKVRRNIKGHLYTFTYGNISSISANPIEKKPLFHFYPGTKALTVGSWSCNFRCPWCQNWDISQQVEKGTSLTPVQFVNLIKPTNCQGTSISFNEPTLLWEWMVEVFYRAKESGYYNTLVTNGFINKAPLKELILAGLDAVNIDVKGINPKIDLLTKGKQKVVWDNCLFLKDKGIHIEITTLIVTGVNDNLEELTEISRRIYTYLGNSTPWHCNCYYPQWKFKAPSPSVNFLKEVFEVAKKTGLNYVYLGNLSSKFNTPYQNTYCPKCKALLIKRDYPKVIKFLNNKYCLECGEEIAGVYGEIG